MGYPNDKITNEGRLDVLNRFGGYVRTSLIEKEGHTALPNTRAQYVINHGTIEQIDSRMTGWGYDEELATECLYNNIKAIMWNMVKVVE